MTASLSEVFNVRQVPGEPRRRWFTSNEFDLIVWCDESGRPAAFQLCYDKPLAERALTWTPELGFVHTAVDDGEGVGGKHKGTPILAPNGSFAAIRVSERFAEVSGKLPRDIVEFVDTRLRQHPSCVHPA